MADDQRATLVAYSWEELEETQSQLSAAIDAGNFESNTLQTWLDAQANSVVLEAASSMVPAQVDAVGSLASKFGQKVQIRRSEEPLFRVQALSCRPYLLEKYCSPPLRGGVAINPHGDTEYICTAGFRARGANGKRYLLTAGHCVARYGQPLTYWDSMDDQINIEQSQEVLEQHLHYIGSLESYSFPTHDWAKIDATGQEYDTAFWPSRIVEWGENAGTLLDEAYAITSESAAYENEIVCHSGATTGTSCAPVDRVDMEPVNVTGAGPSGLVYHENRAHGGCAYGGDSGGPVFANHQALGIISAGDNLDIEHRCNGPYWYFTNIEEATSAMDVKIAPLNPLPSQTSLTVSAQSSGVVKSSGTLLHSGVPIEASTIDINFYRNNNGQWVLSSTTQASAHNGAYSAPDVSLCGGEWLVKAHFSGNEMFADSESQGQVVSLSGAPGVETGDSPEVRDSEALITGTVSPQGCSTTFHFEYGLSNAYGQTIPLPDESVGSGTAPVVVSKTITGLEPRSHYHYRLVATNQYGTAKGADRTFTTGVKWLLRNSNGSGGAENTAWLGLPGSYEVSGDWDGDGVATPGSFNPVTGVWRISNSLSKVGKVDQEFQYGGSGAKPVVGNWDGVGADGIGVYYPSSGMWDLRECVCGGNPTSSFGFGGGPWSNPVAGDWNGDGQDTIGVYDPQAGNWNLRDSTSSGGADHAFQYGGGVFQRGLAGDWNGDGIDTIGVYDPQAGNWTMRNSNTTGGPDISFQFGGSQFGTVVGDWDGNGTDTVALTDDDATVERNWLLRNSNSAGGADLGYFFGLPGQIGVVGDWNGDGFKTLGSFDPATGTWRLTNSNSSTKPDQEFQYGGAGAKPVVGNWDGIGADGIGVYYSSSGMWDLRECVCGGNPTYSFGFGGGPWSNPVAGDWNKDGVDTIGVYDPTAGNWNLRDSNSSGGADHAFGYGGGPWSIGMAGDWNGDGTDTIGVYDPIAGNWNLRDSNTSGGADHAFQFGGASFQPITGDWDGNGAVTAGLILNHGEVLTPARSPIVAAQAPTGVTESGKATLNGTVNPNGFATRYRFEWGATTSYGNSVPANYASAGLGNSAVPVGQQITGLLGGTTYHYRLVAESGEGKQISPDKAFETPPGDGTAERLSEMAISEPFNGSAASVANFNSNWAKLGWASGKGEDLASGWRSSASYPAVQGAFSNTTLSDEKGAAVVATMATNPGSGERGFSLSLDMGSPTGASRSGYELHFTYVSSNSYSVALAKWSGGTKTPLASKTGVTFANGNSLALVDKGSSVSAWVKTGSSYSELLSASDSTFSSGTAGVEAAGSTTRLTNFKLGSLLPNTTSEAGTTTAWNLRYSNTTGPPDLSVQFGVSGKKEVVGDWNGDGISTLGTFDGSSGTWKLRNANGPGPAEIVIQFGGGAYSTPIVGDWNGDGVDSIGVFDPSGRNWSLRNSNFAGAADQSFQYGGSGSKPISGNWDGVGADGIGAYYPSSGMWDLRECVCGGSPNYSFPFGGGPWVWPIAGNWDGVGADGIGVYDPTAGNWNLRHCMCSGNPDYSFQYGGGAWVTPLAGDWKGNGTDTVGVAND